MLNVSYRILAVGCYGTLHVLEYILEKLESFLLDADWCFLIAWHWSDLTTTVHVPV